MTRVSTDMPGGLFHNQCPASLSRSREGSKPLYPRQTKITQRATAWLESADGQGGFVRGLEVGLELDEARFVGSSGFLFAAVLERFFGLYVTVNSFTQLVAKFRQHDKPFKRWPPRAGDPRLTRHT